MYLLTHSLSPVLVLVAVMDPKVLKTKISHTHSLILSLLESNLFLSGISWNSEYRSLTMYLYTHTITHSNTSTQCLSLVLVVMI